eukprot:gb/GECG01001494.1/.p1 GENE.gb/GECG01001494.1/~~gb/GECG01001494.1/.p1  ORF type:complete len:144 (+),score=12.60 gb/GECG01001494.1/:1-432(+)
MSSEAWKKMESGRLEPKAVSATSSTTSTATSVNIIPDPLRSTSTEHRSGYERGTSDSHSGTIRKVSSRIRKLNSAHLKMLQSSGSRMSGVHSVSLSAPNTTHPSSRSTHSKYNNSLPLPRKVFSDRVTNHDLIQTNRATNALS